MAQDITLDQIRRIKFASARRMAGLYDLPVFRVVENGKKPADVGWQAAATRDLAAVETMWREAPDHNIGISTAGLLVVDIDPRHGGEESWRQIVEEWALFGEEVPQTLEVRTWSGGRHIYFRAPVDAKGERIRIASSVGDNGGIAPGIDIRAWGALVVAPGSFVNGEEYRIIAGKEGDGVGPNRIPVAPDRLVAMTKKKVARAENAGERVTEETEQSVLAVRALVDAHPPVERGARNISWYKLAAQFGDTGADITTARDEGWRWVHEKVDGGMEEGEFEQTLASAYGAGRANPIGNKNPGAMPPHPDLVEIDPGDPPHLRGSSVETVETPKRPAIPVLTWAQAGSTALDVGPEPLVDELIGQRQFSVIYGASGAGKSFVVMDMDFHIATGMKWFGRDVKQGAVVWVAAERAEEARHRILAMTKHYEKPDIPFFLIPKALDLQNPRADLAPLVAAIREIEATHGVKVEKVTIDTLARVMMGADENSTQDMSLLIANLAKLQDALRTHVCLIHHTSIGEQRMRGNYALKGAVDTQIEINKKSREIYVEKESGWKDGYTLGKFKLKDVHLGPHPRTRKMVMSCVIEEAMTTHGAKPLKGLTPLQQRLLDAIDAALVSRSEEDDVPEHAAFDLRFILGAAAGAGMTKEAYGKAPGKEAKSTDPWYQWILKLAGKLEASLLVGRSANGEYFRALKGEAEVIRSDEK